MRQRSTVLKLWKKQTVGSWLGCLQYVIQWHDDTTLVKNSVFYTHNGGLHIRDGIFQLAIPFLGIIKQILKICHPWLLCFFSQQHFLSYAIRLFYLFSSDLEHLCEHSVPPWTYHWEGHGIPGLVLLQQWHLRFLKYLTGMGLLPFSQYVMALDLHWVNFSLVLIKCCSKFLFTWMGFDEKKANENVRCLTEEVTKGRVSRNWTHS